MKIEIAPGQVLTSAITNASVNALGLTVGCESYVAVKSSDVMIAVD